MVLVATALLLPIMKLLEDTVTRGEELRLGDSILTWPLVGIILVAAVGAVCFLRVAGREVGAIGPLVVALAFPVAVDGLRVCSHGKAIGGRAVVYRDAVREMDATATPNYLAIGNWSEGILYDHYVHHELYTPRWLDTAWLEGVSGEIRREQSRKVLEDAISTGREVWLLGDCPICLAKLRHEGYTIEPLETLRRARAPGG